MRSASIAVLFLAVFLACVFGPGRESFARLSLAVGLPGLAASVSGNPSLVGYALIAKGDYVAAGERLEYVPGALAAYNRAEAMARTGHIDLAVSLYDKVLATPHLARALSLDAAANRQLLVSLKAIEEAQKGGKAPTNAAAMGQKDRNVGDPGDGGSEKATSGAGRAGDKESDAAAQAPGGSKVARVGTSRQGEESGIGDARGSAGDAGGAGRSGGQASAAVITMAEAQRNVQKRHDDRAVPATKQWLKTLTDDPGAFLRAQLVAEQERRKRTGTAAQPLADQW